MATGRLPDPNTAPLTAKGDLYTYSTVPARLAVGNNGDTLVADSSTSTGLRYTAGNAMGNPVLNSSFQIWQRGTSFAGATSSSQYSADRWFFTRGGAVAGGTISRQTTSDTTNLPNIQYCARIQRDSGNTSTNLMQFAQPFETLNSIPFVGKTVTLSFYARKGANYSSSSNGLAFYLRTGTGTDQNPIWAGYTGTANTISATATLTDTWQRFSASALVGTSVTEIAPVFEYTPTGTAGAADYYEITGVQIDIGSVALPYRSYSATLAGELAACQRYYWRQTADNAYSGFGGFGVMFQAAYASIQVPLPVTMRTTPTFARSTVNLYDGAGESAIVTVGANRSTTKTGTIELEAGANWSVIGRPCIMRANNSTAAWVEWSAEL